MGMSSRRSERVAAYNENLQNSRLIRFKELREHRTFRFNQNLKNYQYILNTVQEYFEIDQGTLINFLLDDVNQIEILERFISNSSVRAIRFIQDFGKAPGLESGRFVEKMEEPAENMTIFLTTDENILKS